VNEAVEAVPDAPETRLVHDPALAPEYHCQLYAPVPPERIDVIEIPCPMSIATGDGESDPAEGSEVTTTMSVVDMDVWVGVAPVVVPLSVAT
jgi:hypothetical protein